MTDATTSVPAAGDGAPAALRISDSLGLSSLLVLVGVVVAWVLVTGERATIDVSAAQPQALAQPLQQSEDAPVERPMAVGASLVDRGEQAFAAGRVLEPEGDNALDWFREALEALPGDRAARAGVERVTSYALNRAQRAMERGDWNSAQRDLRRVSAFAPDVAADLTAQITLQRRLGDLADVAFAQVDAARLVMPEGDNAAQTYRTMLELEPGNAVATEGLQRVAERLLGNAQSALLASEYDEAGDYLAAVRSVAPGFAGTAELSAMIDARRQEQSDSRLQDLLAAASRAVRDGNLMTPADGNAHALYRRVLAADPDNDAAARGLSVVREGLVSRIRTALAANQPDDAETLITQARVAGVADAGLADLERRYRAQRYVADFEAGRREIRRISEFEVLNRVNPQFPQRWIREGRSGWVEIEFTVDTDGEVRDVDVTASSADALEDPAERAVRRWRFRPLQMDGYEIPARTAIRFSFQPTG